MYSSDWFIYSFYHDLWVLCWVIQSNGNQVLLHCAQSCPTLWDPVHHTLLDFSVRGISQARILEWVAISFSKESSRPRDQTWLSCVSCTNRRILYLLSHLGSAMEAEHLPEKHNPVLSGKGRNAQGFTPQSHSQPVPFSKKVHNAKSKDLHSFKRSGSQISCFS